MSSQVRSHDQAWFKQLFDISPDPTWIIDGDQFVACNTAAAKALGYASQDELLNLHPSKLSPSLQPDGQDSHVKAEQMMSIARDTGLHRFEWTHTKSDGTDFIAEVTLSLVTIDAKPLLYCVWRDISERNQASEALRRSEQNLAITLDSIGDAVIATDAAGRVTRMNPTAELLTGWTLSEAAGRPLSEVYRLINAQTCLPATNPTQQVIQSATVMDPTNHSALMARDGHEYLINDSTALIRGDSGRVAGVVVVFSDVTEKYQTQLRIAAQQAFSARLIAASPDPMYVKDCTGQLLMVNQAWCDFTGVSSEEAVGSPSVQAYPDYDPIDPAMPDERLMCEGGSAKFEVRMPSRTSGMRDVMVHKAAFQDGKGQVIAVIGTLLDVSTIREAERRTMEAKEAAERADASKTEFMSNMSHELRTPLQSIIGFSELGLTRFPEIPKVGLSFKRIHDAGERMLVLVNNLLALSQADLDTRRCTPQLMPVLPLLCQQIEELQAQFGAHEVRCSVDTMQGASNPLVWLDEAGFRQLMGNVLANALRFTPVQGSVLISVQQEASSQAATIRVSDDGPGIPEDELESIFQPFVLSSRTKDGSGGTGLGLPICRRIAASHGGSIRAENRPGGGAVFIIEFPAHAT